MKAAFIAVCAACLLGVALASAAKGEDLVATLEALSNHCVAVGMDRAFHLPSDSTEAMERYSTESSKIVEECVSDAETRGADAYKAFIASTKDAPLKTSAKNLMAKWLAFTGTIRPTSQGYVGDRELAELHQAEASFKVDSL